MKKIISILLIAILGLCTLPALAETADSATTLPMGVSFGMSMDELSAVLGDDAVREMWYEQDDETGTLMMEAVEMGIGDITAANLYFQVDRNNSDKTPRLSMISGDLPVGENVIANFKALLSAMTEVYGAPDSDPFDEGGVESYVEYGMLSATWTKPEVRINIGMNRMYDESLNLDYTYRLNYDAEDLK